MASELEKVLNQQETILKSGPWTTAAVAVVFLVSGVVSLFLTAGFPGNPLVAAAPGISFAIAAMAFVANRGAIQSKVNLEIVKALNDLKERSGEGE